MSDIHALSGAYAVDALDDIERAQFERHLAGCADCLAEVAGLREAAATLPEIASMPAPAGMRARVLDEIARVRPLPPVVTPVERARRRFRPVALVAAAAAVVAIAGGVAVTQQPWADETSQVQLGAADEILQADDAEVYEKTFPDGARAVLTRSPSKGAVIQTSDMALPPSGMVYELWLQHDGEMVPAGFMPREGDAVVVLAGDVADADGFGITVEPEGGAPDGEPSNDPVALIPFENA